MDQTHDLIKRLEEENKELKKQISQFDTYKLQLGYLKDILKYRKEVVTMITNEGLVEDITDSISAYGYEPDEFTSGKLSFWDIIHPDDLRKFRENIEKKTLAGSKGFDYDYRIRTKNGETVWVLGTLMPVTGESAGIERYVIKINNVNKRKKFEEELLDANENLFMTMKSIDESVILVDADGYINRLNAAAEKLIGIISLKAKNKHLGAVVQFSFSPDFQILIDPLTMEPETRQMVQLDEIFMRSSYGGQYRIACNLSPIIVQKSKLAGYVMVIKDMTSIYSMQQTILESKNALKTRLETLLSSDVAVTEVQLTDIIPIERLQSLQDKFSVANGVSSVITDLNGLPITKPSNFNDVCTSIFYSGEECYQVSKLLHNTSPDGHPCKLADAKAPIYIGGKHIADWKIGMCGFGGVIAPFVKKACGNNEKYSQIYTGSQAEVKTHFQDVCNLLEIMANEISEIGYNNAKLAHELIKGKENEAKLIESETTIRSIFDNSVDGMILTDQNGIVKEWSKGYELLSGITKKQAIGKYLWELVKMMLPKGRYSDEEIEQMHVELDKIIHMQMHSMIVRHILNLKTKQERIVHALYFPVHVGDRTMIGAISRDVTEDTRNEQELVDEKERIQSLGDNFPNGCLFRFIFDLHTNQMSIAYLGKTWDELTDIPREEAIKDVKVAFSRILPEDMPVYMRAVKKSVTDMSRFNVEVRYIGNQKETKWLQISSQPRREGAKVICDGFMLDITHRKNVELKLEAYRTDLENIVKDRTEELEASNEELYATNEEFAVINEELHQKNDQLQHEVAARKEVMQKLEDSENKMRNFITQSFEGIVILDNEGKVIEWNEAQQRITGISREDAIGKYSWDLYKNLMKQDEAEEKTEFFHQRVLSFLNTGILREPEESEHIFYLPGDNERYINMTSFPIGLADKCYLGEIVRDITEQKMIDMELERYRTQLEEMVAAQTKELIASKERLTSLSDNLPGGVIYQMYDKAGQDMVFTYVSARFVEMFHISVDNVMKDSSLFFNLMHPDDRAKFEELHAKSYQTGFIDVECRVNLDTGRTQWIHMRSSHHIMEDGVRVWDGFMVDITDKKVAEQELEESRKRQNILIKVLQIVQSSEKIPEALHAALTEIGKYAEVSRCYIFEKSADGRTADNTYEWCNEGVTPEIDHLQGVPIEYMSDWFEAFEAGGYICASDIVTLSPTAYEQLSLQGIKSILVLPLVANGINYGFVGFDECSRYKDWQKNEVELLISLSQIISTTTRRYWAERSIQLSQQTMRTVLDNINASIYVADFDTYEVLFANKLVKDQMGEDVEGKKCWQVLQKGMTGPCDFCPNPKLLDEKKKPTGLCCWEHWNANIDRWFECTDAAIEWVDGRLVHMEYATDITDRKAAEEALRQSEDMYRQLTVASPDAIVVCDPQGKVVYVSPKARELFLINEDTDITRLRLAHFVHSHDLRKAVGMFQLFTQDNVAFLPQLLLVREDGSDFFGEISSASVKDDRGRTASVIMVIRDITERKMTEMELIRAKEKAEESDNLKSAFLANMSHEIRTPINGIIGFLNFLADDNLPPKRRQEYITVVNNSSIQLVKLIDDIIDVAKIEAKQMSIRPIPFQINGFMEELQVFFETYLQANNKDKIALLLDDSGFIDQCVTYVDPMRLRQVLTNLIGNAIKFTEKGFIRFGYRLLSADKLEFVVEDSGIGLAGNQLEIIFERFRQAELTNSRRYGGTGLGLTISRSLVQMMGGDIRVESIEGEGSTFYFTISYLPVSKKDMPLLEEVNAECEPDSQPFKNMAILVAEPGTMKSKYYEKLLSATGAALIFTQTVQQWIDTVSQRKHIDVVLADADIFNDGDHELAKQVKSVRAGLPLVLIVPERNEKYDRLICDSQCNRVIEEPVDFDKLFGVLKKYAKE